jgi:RNA polymerase sigma-70 factor (ECF subfamily)
MLPEKYRTPLVLFYMEETSYRDIANSLDIPMGTVMSSISRGRAFIKKELLKGARAAGSGEAGQDVNKVVSIKKARNLDGL